MSETYTVVNRIGRKVETIWDGKIYELAPHAKGLFVAEVAHAFKRHNVQKGSLDPITGNLVWYVGVEELKDPCDPLEQEILINPKTGKPHTEIWNRERLTGARPSEEVAGDNGLYSEQMWKRGQSTDLNFSGR